MTTNNFKGVTYVTQEQFDTLSTTGSLTVDGVTYNYEPDERLYVTDSESEMSGGIKTLTYDNTTLAEHIDEILSYVNNENGGNLLTINLKLSSAISGEMKSLITTLSTATTSYSTSTVNIVNADEMLYLIVGSIRKSTLGGYKITFQCTNDTESCSFTNVDISNIGGTTSASISGHEFTFETDSIINNYFKDIDISTISLEHLVINYFVV